MKTLSPYHPRSAILARLVHCLAVAMLVATATVHGQTSDQQDTLSPPSLGQHTKGTPSIDETTTTKPGKDTAAATQRADEKVEEQSDNSVFGTTTIKESKRESGQIYLIELEHSTGSKQYIEETDSDGKIESTSNDIEETPNLPKWKIGSW